MFDSFPIWLVLCVSAYLMGSINLSIAAVRIAGVDGLRTTGSGNPGVTNLYRTAGGKIASAVLLGEIGKAFLAVQLGAWVNGQLEPILVLPYVFGNLYPVFHKFKGGKGISAVVGTFLAAGPLVMLFGGCVFFLFFVLFRRVSVGSLSMVCSYPLWAYWIYDSTLLLGVSLCVVAVVVFTHRQNIRRLFLGEEPRLSRGKK